MQKQQGENICTNFDIIRKLDLPIFANMIFNVAKYDCETLEDFEEFLSRGITAKNYEALQEILPSMQGSDVI